MKAGPFDLFFNFINMTLRAKASDLAPEKENNLIFASCTKLLNSVKLVRVSASQNDGKKQMALKCTEISFFKCFIIQIGSSTSIFFFPGVNLIEKPKFGD